MCDADTGIPFHIEEKMTKFVLETLTVRHKGVDSRLSASLAWSIKCIVRKMVSSTQTIAKVTKAVIRRPGVIARNTALIMSERRKYTDERAKKDEHCNNTTKQE